MINFKKEVEKRKEQLIQDIETLCAIPSVYNEKTIGESERFVESCPAKSGHGGRGSRCRRSCGCWIWGYCNKRFDWTSGLFERGTIK